MALLLHINVSLNPPPDHAWHRPLGHPWNKWLEAIPHIPVGVEAQLISQTVHRYTQHAFNSPFSRTTHVSQYQKGKTNLDFTEARDSEWQWH